MPGLDPADVVERDAVLVGEHAAGVDRRGLASTPARRCARRASAAGSSTRPVVADEDRRVAERARGEHGDRDQRVVAGRAQRAVLRERQLGDVPFAKAREAEEDLLDRDSAGSVSATPSTPTAPAGEVADVVVVVDRERQRDGVAASRIRLGEQRRDVGVQREQRLDRLRRRGGRSRTRWRRRSPATWRRAAAIRRRAPSTPSSKWIRPR